MYGSFLMKLNRRLLLSTVPSHRRMLCQPWLIKCVVTQGLASSRSYVLQLYGSSAGHRELQRACPVRLTAGRAMTMMMPASTVQVLLWRPAEILNGRMAMLGFTIGVGNQLFTHQSVWQQLYFNPVSARTKAQKHAIERR